MLLKIDLKKSFDRLEWSFIRQDLVYFNHPGLSKLIMFSISSSSISMPVNGGYTYSFKPSRGIKQGDLLSPYIFILCMELLSRRINHEVDALQ